MLDGGSGWAALKVNDTDHRILLALRCTQEVEPALAARADAGIRAGAGQSTAARSTGHEMHDVIDSRKPTSRRRTARLGLWESDGVRVVELGSGISAAFGARLLADFGADVIKVEDLDGDASRLAGPFPGDMPHPERSGSFLYLNFNKRGVSLDSESATGKELLQALFSDADAVIENLGAGSFDALTSGLVLPPNLVVCSVSPYGQDGPKAGYVASEISACASGGLMYMTGTDDRPPVKEAFNQAGHLAGVNAAAATLAAVRQARRSGVGQRIDISEQETVAMTIFPALNVYSHTGADVKRAPTTLPKLATSQAMESSDGWVMPSDAGIDVWWETFAEFVACPELLEWPFAGRESRHQHEDAIDAIVAPVFRGRTKADLFHGGQERGLTMSSIQTSEDVANCPHLDERGYFVTQDHPAAGTIRMPGMVPLTCGVVDRTPSRPAPLLGQHTEAVVQALKASFRPSSDGDHLPRGAAPETDHGLPLDGVRILELGMVFVLPLATTPLAALGADVIKIESAIRPDSVRSGPMPGNTPRPGAYNHAGNFHLLNRNKRGIAVDLTTDRGREIVLDLVRVSDVVAENFTPRVLHNLGLDYEQLRRVNPGIILLSSSGFGQTGPWRNYKAYGPTTESVDGLMHLTGYPDRPPTRAGAGGFGVAFTDVAGAYYGTYSILAALEYRDRTGKGLWLDLSHYEAGAATLPEPMLDFTMNAKVHVRAGNRHQDRAPQGAYPCQGEDEWVAISISSDDQFDTLVQTLGLDGSDWDRFATVEQRRRDHDRLDVWLGSATRSWPPAKLETTLQAAGIEAARLLSPRDVWLDPQLRSRGFVELVEAPTYAPEIGPRVFPRPAWRMSGAHPTTTSSAPAFGQHTTEVLAGFLGLTGNDNAELERDGVTANSPREGLVSARQLDLEGLLRAGRLRGIDNLSESLMPIVTEG